MGHRGGASLCKLPRPSGQSVGVAGLAEAVERQDARAEVVELVAADDRMAGDAGLAAADRYLAGRLAVQSLLVDFALASDDERGCAHARVEAERVEDEG